VSFPAPALTGKGSPLSAAAKQLHAHRDAILRAGFRADENFLHSFLSLRHSLESAGNLTLDAHRSCGAAAAEGFSAVGTADDHTTHAIQRLDPFHHGLAFLRSRLVASA
jgi:hypothetical protein